MAVKLKVPDAGVGEDPNLVSHTDEDEEIAPNASHWLEFDPEIGTVIHTAVHEGWGQDQLTQALQETSAFREVNDRRAALADPSQADDARAQLGVQVSQMLQRPTTDPAVQDALQRLQNGQATMASVQMMLGPLGQEGTPPERVIDLAASHGIPMSPQNAAQWTGMDEQTLDQQFAGMSQGLYPWKPPQIPYAQFASMFADVHQSEMGQPVDVQNPRFQQMLEQAAGNLGQYRQMLRSTDDWQNSSKGQQAITARTNDLVQSLLNGDATQEEMASNRSAYEQQVMSSFGQALLPLAPQQQVQQASQEGPGAVNLPPIPEGAQGQVLAVARRYLGVPYRWGGTNPGSGLDCSGYTQLVFRQLGVNLPRTAAQQAGVGQRVRSLADAQPGDLVFWHHASGNHIGIYAGNGMFYEAPHTGDVVKLARIGSMPTSIRRVL